MKLQSPGYASELIFMNFDGQVEDRDTYLVMRTLSSPEFHWGNLILFDRAPKSSDYEEWIQIFKKEFTDPRTHHITLAWDVPEIGEIERFTENGFTFSKQVTLTATEVTMPPYPNIKLEVRPLQSKEEWDLMVEIQIESAHDNLPRKEWIRFYNSQRERYEKMKQQNLGHWFGGFIKGKLVAGLGLFHNGEMGRYQIVSTHPDYRRQGICGTLVYQTALHAFESMKLKKLVMCADQDYHAARVYESVGFKPSQLEYGVSWWNKTRA